MPLYITAQRISEAIDRLGHSTAKRSALFDFLIVKRTLAIKEEPSAAISEGERAFISALEEIGGCGQFNGAPVKSEDQHYLNPFAIKDSNQGYRPIRYRSNGTNSTISGRPWERVITLDNSRPRRASLAPDYLEHLRELVLTKSRGDRPNIYDAAIWYFRDADVEGLTSEATNIEDKLDALVQGFKESLGLTDEEVDLIFDLEVVDEGVDEDQLFSEELADPREYLPTDTTITGTDHADDYTCPLTLVTALSAKNFVILTGPSGTGKSRSAIQLAESLYHHTINQVSGISFQLITVGPDWTSPKRLLGYRTPFGKLRELEDGTETHESYEITETMRLILRASHPDVAKIPHFLIFDEMNLSHVERYFAPFLSLMEAANVLDERDEVSLIDPLDFTLIAELLQAEDPTSSETQAAQALIADGRSFILPSNLFFIGTVNIDETTYMFSPKVLDRAYVIEIESKRPSSYLTNDELGDGEVVVSAQQAMELLQQGIDDREEQRNELTNPADILDRLADIGFTDEEVNNIKALTVRALDGCYDLLSPVGFAFGYRISKEVFSYLYVWITAEVLRGVDRAQILQQWPRGLDRAILQKVLPKLHGNKRVLGDSLRALKSFLSGNHQESDEPARYSFGMGRIVGIPPAQALTLGVNPQMPLSTRKLGAMQERLNALGHVSFVS